MASHGAGMQPRAAGFTLVEVMIYLVIALSVIGSIYQLVIRQSRSYSTQREVRDVRGTLRGAGVLLSSELMAVSAAVPDSDLYAIGANGVTLRSVQGTAVICSEHPTANVLRYGLKVTAGDITATADDSALVFAAGGTTATDDTWKRLKITSVMAQGGSGVLNCFWGDATAGKGKGKGSLAGVTSTTGTQVPDLVVEVTGNMDNVYMGAPVLAFRKVEYGLYQDQGRWWLGRRIGASATWEKLTGPMRATDGLALIYYDAAGAVLSPSVAANRFLVAEVELVLRGESFGKAERVGGALTARQDSMRTRVALRN
jgi:type II secretory pathway pseudopilin PulG